MKKFFSPVIRGSSSSSNATPGTPTNVAEPNVEVQAQSGPNVDVLPPQSEIMLKDKIVVYDLSRQRVGWVKYNCS